MRLTAAQSNLQIDKEKCTQCGVCTHICWTHAMKKGEDGYPVMSQNDPSDSWHSCWGCQRCMASCPTGALGICGKKPEDSATPDQRPTPESVDALVLTRRTCRDFKQEDIPLEKINHILSLAATAPSAGCNQQVRFSVVTQKEVMKKLSKKLWQGLLDNAEQGIFPGSEEGFNEKDFRLVERGINHGKDVIFRNAPHMLLIHAPKSPGSPTIDTAIALTYGELLFSAHGFGTVVASFGGTSLRSLPGLLEELGIPEDHFLQAPLLFGIPSLTFPRGTQRFDHMTPHIVTL